jgi:hypothetical protein
MQGMQIISLCCFFFSLHYILDDYCESFSERNCNQDSCFLMHVMLSLFLALN